MKKKQTVHLLSKDTFEFQVRDCVWIIREGRMAFVDPSYDLRSDPHTSWIRYGAVDDAHPIPREAAIGFLLGWGYPVTLDGVPQALVSFPTVEQQETKKVFEVLPGDKYYTFRYGAPSKELWCVRDGKEDIVIGSDGTAYGFEYPQTETEWCTSTWREVPREEAVDRLESAGFRVVVKEPPAPTGYRKVPRPTHGLVNNIDPDLLTFWGTEEACKQFKNSVGDVEIVQIDWDN